MKHFDLPQSTLGLFKNWSSLFFPPEVGQNDTEIPRQLCIGDYQ